MLRRVFKAFQYRDFRLLWFGACTSSIGTWMQEIAQNWLVLEITKSPFLLGLDAFLGDIPIFLFSLFGGVIADRMDRRHLLIGSQLVQMTSAIALAILISTGRIQVWHILLSSFVVGTAQSFGGPAYSALVPSLVEKEDLPNAIALNSIQFNLARVIGPVLGGLALKYVGRPAPNAALLGTFAALVGIVSLDSVLEAIRRAFPGKVGEANVQAAKAAHALVSAKAAA